MVQFSRLPGVSSEHLGELASFFGIAVATTDANGHGLALNSQWRSWISPKEAMYRDWLTAFEPSDHRRIEEALEDARTHAFSSIECRFLCGQRSPLWVHLRIFPMLAATGEIEGFIVGASDISQLHRITERFEAAALTTIEALSKMEAVRDLYTAGHQHRVGRLAEAIGAELGLGEADLTSLRIAGMLHDVGKVGTPIEILTKPAKLTAGEYSVMKEHSANGYGILMNVTSDWPVARVAHEHHERMDGSGYPRGLHGSDILLEARITSVADVVESMAVHRPYRSGLGIDVALDEIQKHKGVRYDSDSVEACVKIIERGFDLSPAAHK